MSVIKKVLLVVPPGTVFVQPDGTKQCKECPPPLGLAYLAAALRNAGEYDIRIYDMVVENFYKEARVSSDTILYGDDFDDYRRVLEEFRPDLVGIQCMLSSRSASVLKLCQVTKEYDPGVYTVLGGHHASALPEHVLQQHTDFVVAGEADYSFPELVATLFSGGDVTEVAGIFYRRNGKVVSQRRIDFVKDLDVLPRPAWDLVGVEKYWLGVTAMGLTPREKYAVVNTSRGCPHICHYCAVPLHTGERNYRKRSIESVIEEIRWLVDDYGVEEIHFFDDNFFVDKKRLKQFIRLLIENFPGKQFAVPTGTDLSNIDDEIIDLLQQAGFYHLSVGIETGSMDLQGKYVDKAIDLTTLTGTFGRIRRAGIKVTGFFLLGFPDETPEQMQKTAELATSLDLDFIHMIMLTPLPGSQLYDYCVQNNLLYDDFDVTKLRYSNTFIINPNASREYVEGLRKSVWKEYMSQRIDVEAYNSRGFASAAKG